LHPLLKAIMGRRVCTQLGLIQCLPLAAGSQHVENRVCTLSIGHAGASPAKAMRIDVDREQRLQYRPQLIGDLKPCRGGVIRRPLPFSLLDCLFVHSDDGIRVCDVQKSVASCV
jgi:hypothetical protein